MKPSTTTYPATFAETRAKTRQFTPNDFTIGKMIGEGKYGRVFRVKPNGSNKILVMKTVNKKEIIVRGVERRAG